MITPMDGFTQKALTETLYAPQNKRLFNFFERWLTYSGFARPITNQDELDAANAAGQLAEPKFGKPELDCPNTLSQFTILILNRNVDPDTGIAKEIEFALHIITLDDHGNEKSREFSYNGAIINHGTVDEPKWSIHT